MVSRSLSVGSAKGLKHTAWDSLPMMTADHNGAEKSTLLHQLYRRTGEQAEPGEPIILGNSGA